MQRSPIFFTVAVFLLAATLSCGTASSGRPGALVLIVIDTLRADHVGCLGYEKATTPNLDALAARGILFTRATTSVPVTLPAISTLFTGRQPFHHGVRDNERYVLSAEEHTLAERLKTKGWRTGAVVASAIIGADRGLDQGFDVYDDAFTGPYPVYRSTLNVFAEEFASTRRRADNVTDRAISLLDSFGKDPFFLFVHYFDVHGYYDPPPAYDAQHQGRPYDGEIAFVDAEIGRLLKRLGKRSDAAVMVVSDHGEGLGEHGEYEHGFFVYQATLKVPVIVAGPAVPAGMVRNDPIGLVDLEPTVASWLGLPAGDLSRDGRTLQWDRPEAEPVPLYSETFRTLVSYNWSELRSIQDGDWKLIHGPTDELYDLARDPNEVNDLGDADPAPRLRRLLEEMHGHETRAQVLAAVRGDLDADRKELVESLGYIGGSEEGTETREYPHPRDAVPEWMEYQQRKRLYRKGMTLAMQGEYVAALTIFDSVLTRDKRPDVYFNSGLTHRHLGNSAGFVADIQTALRLDPDYVPALAVLARANYEAGDHQLAFERWTRIYGLDPTHVPTLRALSKWYTDRDDLEASLPYLRALVNQVPQDVVMRYNLGMAAAQLGRSKEAEDHLETFLRIAPNHSHAAKARETLQELPGD